MIRMMNKFLFFIIMCNLFISSTLFCQNIYWPYESKLDNPYIIKNIISDVVLSNSKGYPFSTSLLLNPIALYQRSLSNSSCQYYPSCSRYTYLSIYKYGSIKGLVLGAERLTRCFCLADASKYFRVGPFYYDPPLDFFNYNASNLTKNSYEIFLHGNLQKYLTFAANPVFLHQPITANFYEESDSLLFLFSSKEVDCHELGFACFLYQNQKYYQASTELYRYLYNHKNYNDNYPILTLIALCNFQSGRYADAANLFANSAQHSIQDKQIIFSTYMQGLALYYDCRYDQAKNILSNLLSFQNSPFRKQILTMYILSCIKMNDRESALSVLEKYHEHEDALKIQTILSNKKKRSPLLATIMSSIFPGSGQFYSNHYREGFFGIIVNSLFGYVFYDSYKNGTSSDKIFHGFLFLQFYSSNILAGKRAAIVHNEIDDDKAISNILSFIKINTDFPLIEENGNYYIKIE